MSSPEVGTPTAPKWKNAVEGTQEMTRKLTKRAFQEQRHLLAMPVNVDFEGSKDGWQVATSPECVVILENTLRESYKIVALNGRNKLEIPGKPLNKLSPDHQEICQRSEMIEGGEKRRGEMVQMFRLETHQYLLTINAPEFCTVDGTDRICCLLTDRGEIVGALRPFPAIYLCKLFFPTRPIPLTTTYTIRPCYYSTKSRDSTKLSLFQPTCAVLPVCLVENVECALRPAFQ